MDEAQTHSLPGPKSKRRRLSVVSFGIFGSAALISAMVLPFDPMAALPWVIVSWSIAGFSGYQIWHIDHPGKSARAAVGIRGRWLASAAVGLVLVLIVQAVDPAWLVAGVVVWILALVALGLVLGSLSETEREIRASHPSPAEGEGGEVVMTSEERTAGPDAP